MNLILKTALDKNQIDSRASIGDFYGWEIHLNDFIINNDMIKYAEDIVPIINVHAPLGGGKENLSYLLDNLFSDEYSNLLNLCGENGYKLVVHCNMNVEDVLNHKNIGELLNVLNNMKVVVYLENMSIIAELEQGFIRKSDDIRYIVAQRLNNIIGDEIFIPLTDICHLISDFNNNLIINTNLNNFLIISETSKTLKHKGGIHLSNALGDGIGIGKHGVGFENNLELLSIFIEKVKQIEENTGHVGEIVLEFLEIDNNNPHVVSRNYQLIKEIEKDSIY